MSRPIRAVALAGVVAIAAACGGTTGPSPAQSGVGLDGNASPSPASSGSPGASAGASPSASAGASAAPGVSASPGAGSGAGGASPSPGTGTIGSNELEALEREIPTRIGGVSLQTMSFTAADIADAGIDPALGAGIGAISTDLLNSAVALGVSLDVSQPLIVTLVSVPGGRAETLETTFAERMREVNRGNVTVRERTIAGTEVIEVNAGSDAIGTVLWAEGDTLHVVQSVDADLRSEAVQALAD